MLKATCDTLALSKHMAASRSKAGKARAGGGAPRPLESMAAMAVQAPAAQRTSCSAGPPHQMERTLIMHARAVGEPSRAISVGNGYGFGHRLLAIVSSGKS